jgi:hypothetical protein
MMRSTESRSTKTTERTNPERARPDTPRRLVCCADPIVAATHRLSNSRRRFLLPALSLPARPGLLLLTALLLGLLCLVMAIPRRPTSGTAVEFALLRDRSSTNLNSTSAEAPTRAGVPQAEEGSPDTSGANGSPPVMAQVRQSADPEAGPAVANPTASPALLAPERLAAPTPEPVSLPPAELPRQLAGEESLPILPATVLEPVREDCYPVRGPHQGDTPMMRTWKMLGLNTLLAALFAATPALGSNTSGPLSDAEKLDEIQKQLNELKNSLAEVKKTLADGRTDASLGAQKVQSQIGELGNQVTQLLDSLRNRTSMSTRIAASPSLDTGPPTGTARIEMANTYSQPVSVVINNRRSYPLQPGERRLSDPIPAGSFSYEILGVTPMVTRTIAADKVFTVWVHPQP